MDKDLNLIGGYRKNFEDFPIYYRTFSKVVQLKGTVAYLSDPTPSNYYHWMCATLPLIRFYEKFFNIKEIDFFYIGQCNLCDFHLESLAKLHISGDRIVQADCTAEKMIAAISSRFLPRFNDPISEEAYLFTRNLFQDDSALSSHRRKRIYVTRGNVTRRKLINESEVINLLTSYGFETIQMDNKTIKEQAEIFSQAEAVVALHGAALSNLLFVPSGVKVLELFPHGYVNNCYYAMAGYAKADYYYLQGDKISQSYTDPHYFDTYINIPKLKAICQKATL
ncbi:MAG: glycosyltransferase family 61 protein [Cyanobacteria bacterium CRU_2_1]|nr:glycosyltransferase family 61 protein [Cyanobacteria bacterium CRU_2_1]